jgi:DNA (cytosine-5)-methyltransferase 1
MDGEGCSKEDLQGCGAGGMRIGSLFAGIGGLELGLERSIPGAHTVWQVEQNPYAQRVLAKHWPEARRYDDVKEVGSHNLAPVELLAGGFPCQDISTAGKQAGIDGERSGLWSEFARLIGELQPQFVVVENVAALLAGGMGRVLGDLAACGYDAIWDCIPAAAVGAHHQRDRIFIVAYANGTRFFKQWWPVAVQAEQSTSQCRSRWEPEPSVGRVANGVPHRVDRLRGLGNAVVPQVAEVVGRVVCQIMELEG